MSTRQLSVQRGQAERAPEIQCANNHKKIARIVAITAIALIVLAAWAALQGRMVC